MYPHLVYTLIEYWNLCWVFNRQFQLPARGVRHADGRRLHVTDGHWADEFDRRLDQDAREVGRVGRVDDEDEEHPADAEDLRRRPSADDVFYFGSAPDGPV